MTSQKFEQEVVPQAEHTISTTFESAEDGLQLLLQRLPDYFQGRADHDDIETLVFCLHRLYNCIDTLYQHTLPALTRLTTVRPMSNTFTHRHAIWEQLQAVLLLLERIESHCHLLLSTTTSILATLDTTEEVSLNVNVPTSAETEQWQQAYEILSTALNVWQEQQKTYLAFATTFAHTSGASLAHIDTSLAMLFDSANAIFGDIIPDIQLVAQGDDEVVATLLFDLMQQNDLLLLQINKLVEPLQQVTKHYAVVE